MGIREGSAAGDRYFESDLKAKSVPEEQNQRITDCRDLARLLLGRSDVRAISPWGIPTLIELNVCRKMQQQGSQSTAVIELKHRIAHG